MLIGGEIPDLVECVDLGTLRVHAPTAIIFVCGGPTNGTAIRPTSLRDAFLRFSDSSHFKDYQSLIAEELNAFFPRGQYNDILSFESDIAQISDTIVLFSESFGSAAELGAFVMVDEIARKLLIVIDDEHYNANSFISLGPVKMLENLFGDSAVCVLNRHSIGITNIRNIDSLNLSEFERIFTSSFHSRASSKKKEHTTLDNNRNGHIVKVIVGLIQHYGALTIEELDTYLYCINITKSETELRNLLLCAEFAGWIVKDRRGLNTYYAATVENAALQYKFLNGSPIRDRIRWKSDIYAYWRTHDMDRFASIQQAAERMAT